MTASGTILYSLLLAAVVAGEETSLDPPVLLPDGQEFRTWERPPAFSRTYYVNQAHPQASDDNPGTQDRPLRTINRAAEMLQPGGRVVIAAGVYRERVRPARGGSGPEQMIGYEAAPGAEVILSGSQVVGSAWTRSGRSPAGSSGRIWTTTLSAEMLPDENPFREVNLTDQEIDRSMPWAVPIKGKTPNTLRRGLVFQDARRLKQVASFDELSRAEGTYWVEGDGRTIHLRPLGNIDPNQARFEVTVRGFLFAPNSYGLGFIRVKGLTFEHAGNCFPRPQRGALSTQRGHHWIIEDCTVRQCNSIGIDIGDQFDVEGPELAEGGRHVVRRNTISDCGIGGIEGKQIEHTLIEENVIRRCGWHDVWRLYECGGIKVHCTRSCLVRRNLVTDSVGAPGIWMDYANENSRCTANVVVNCQCDTGGVFMEASQVPNLVDRNIVWGTRGNGIYQHDCDELTIAQNLVVGSSDAAIRMQVCGGRQVLGRLSTAKRNQILGNILTDNGSMLAISDPENTSDGNLFGVSRKPFDLDAWRKERGWDRSSTVAQIEARLDPERLELTWVVRGNVHESSRPKAITHDFFDRPYRTALSPPGPWASIPASSTRMRLGPGRPSAPVE